MHVVGIGQCSLDYLAIVDSYPRPDTKKEVIEWHEQSGGPVATALVALSRLGMQCRFFGITGDDDTEKKIRDSLAAEKIDTQGLLRRSAGISQLAFIVIEKGTAGRTIFWQRPSGEPLKPEELDDNFLDDCSFLILDGLMSDVSIYAAAKARKRKIPVMLDAGRARPGMLEIARLSDYLVTAEEFAVDLGWSLTQKALQEEKKRLGVKVLTVTQGNLGSITVTDNQSFHVPAFHVNALDTTGAGDVFHGGYIYGILQGWDLRDTVTFASAIAAMKCRKIGGRAGIPTFNEIRQFLQERGFPLLKDWRDPDSSRF
ncbi:MAG: sugar kinase [Nitrospirota bacterium]